ncbi:hypothetical protein [Confluentibacter sediminis]|uniref:hypothetical protein n=1 Tax=Confluentibacter sediminis TaxID=2219045 RepID=UPI0013A69ECC|nr:hypothetical protein [Confluentibacter sediminis]
MEGTFNEVSSFIQGYCSAKKTPISGTEFNRFVCLKNSFPTNYIWTYVIKNCMKNDEDGISNIKETILEFLELSNRMNVEELFQFAIDNANTSEGEPEKVFRKFENALLLGNKKIIQSLILDNDNADLLWKGKYPDSVAEQLNEISENQPIKRIKESENGKSVEIIATGFPFTIELILKNNEWKVNADKIIKLRTENNCA